VRRTEPEALVTDVDEVAQRVVRMVTAGVVTAVDGSDVAVAAGSVCVHGDSPGAVAMAVAVRDALSRAGVEIAPFVSLWPREGVQAHGEVDL
jgi:5-oxoprolinase (ATP-hydrolysing) subunit A